MDRQVLSLTWMDFIAPEFHWTNVHYGKITGVFSIMYAIGVLFAGRIIDRIDTKKGYLWAIGIWSVGACLHALCGVITEAAVGLDSAWALRMARGTDIVARITTVSVSLFIFARSIRAPGMGSCFLIIGALGFIWMGLWIFIYKKTEVHPKVNRAVFTPSRQVSAALRLTAGVIPVK